MMLEIIRHGQTRLNALHKYQGSTDEPLSPQGKAGLCRAPFSPERVYVSTMVRARETAEILFPDSRKILLPGIQELDFGVFEGRSAFEMENDGPYRLWVESGCLTPCPGGESREMLEARVCPAILGLLKTEAAAGAASVTVVAHGGTQMAVGECLAEDFREYWQWGLGSGQGWLFQVDDLKKERPLRVAERTDYSR